LGLILDTSFLIEKSAAVNLPPASCVEFELLAETATQVFQP
jgi:hypothetical protein